MELKWAIKSVIASDIGPLIEPYGIEMMERIMEAMGIAPPLIEPYGIEIEVRKETTWEVHGL